MLERLRSEQFWGALLPLLLMQTLPRRLLAMHESAFPEEVNKEKLSSLPRSVSFNELGSSSTMHPDRETRELCNQFSLSWPTRCEIGSRVDDSLEQSHTDLFAVIIYGHSYP